MTMRKASPKAVGDFTERLLKQGDYRRLIQDRYFRATIAGVAGIGPYLCTLTRTGESRPDGGTYLCATPGYGPVVGDDVLCTWIDANTAIVLWPLSQTTPIKFKAHNSATQSIPTSTWTVVNLDTADIDSASGFDAPSHLYTIPVTGWYQVSLRVGQSVAAARYGAQTQINGAQIGPATVQPGTTNGNVTITDLYFFTQGDTIGLMMFQDNGVAQNNAASGCQLELIFMG